MRTTFWEVVWPAWFELSRTVRRFAVTTSSVALWTGSRQGTRSVLTRNKSAPSSAFDQPATLLASSSMYALSRAFWFVYSLLHKPLSHLCGSSRGSLRFYNRREPQETVNIPRRPRRNRIDRNQNAKQPQRPSARQPQHSVYKNIISWNRRELRLEPRKWENGDMVNYRPLKSVFI